MSNSREKYLWNKDLNYLKYEERLSLWRAK